MRTSKRKLFTSEETFSSNGENGKATTIKSKPNERKITLISNLRLNGAEYNTTPNSKHDEVYGSFSRERSSLTERQQMAILLQLTANTTTSSIESPHTPRCNSIRDDGKRVKLVSKYAKYLSKRNERGETVLHVAAIRGDSKQVQRLIRIGADVNCRDNAGWTPLHEACNHGWLRVGRLLVRAGADVNAKGIDDFTPLHDAAVNGHEEIVELLLKSGASVSNKTVHGKTPLSFSKCPKITKLLTNWSSNCDYDYKEKEETSNIRPQYGGFCSSPLRDTNNERLTCPCLTPRSSRNNMRKSSPQHQTPKGPDKPSSPRLTLRFQPIKPRDERHGGAASKTSEVTSSEPRYQSYCVTMEAAEDVYEFKKDDGHDTPMSSSSTTPDSDVCDQQLNVVSSSKDSTATTAAAVTGTAPALRNYAQMNVMSSGESPSKDFVNRARSTVDNHALASHGSGGRGNERHKVERGGSKDATNIDASDVSAAGKSHSSKNGENSNHVHTDYDDASEGEHDEGKRKRKRDSREETNSKTIVHAGVGISMSLRNHGREKGASPEERKSPQERSTSIVPSSASVSASTAVAKPPMRNSGSETESTQSDAENEAPEGGGNGSNAHEHSQGMQKVPPLKIVIPSTSMAEQDRDRSRLLSRHSLPYIVNSSGESVDSKSEGNGVTIGASSNCDNKDGGSGKDDNKSRDGDERSSSHRVTRSSQRMAAMASATVSLVSLQNVSEYTSSSGVSQGECGSGKSKYDQGGEGSAEEHSGPDMPPRKRKLRPRDGGPSSDGNSVGHSVSSASSSSSVSSHYEEQSMFLNCYEMFLNLRRQIDRRRTNMFVVQPKPPQGFKDYLMNKCSYVLAGNAASRLSVPMIPPPQSLTGSMKELYVVQEKARYNLRLQHIIEREKLTLSFEQETLRVHGRAARAMANQTVPLSVCTILKDEEVYNQIEPEQEEKERNARTRYNGRLFISWIQDVDDKWDKVKKAMLLRHHNEAESLHAAQKLDWEWKMKELGICDSKSTPTIDVIHVPIVHITPIQVRGSNSLSRSPKMKS